MQWKISKKSVNHWIKNNILPFPILRVLSLEYKNQIKKFNEYISKIDKITNYRKSNLLKLPIYFDELLSDNIIYFYGYLLGDGCISKNMFIKLCDGHTNKELVIYSIKHLKNIQKLFKKIFNISSKITCSGNKCDLIVTSKFLSRFFKFFYGFKKDKKIIAKPDIINGNYDKECIFYRGFFDADAGLKVKDKCLILKCKDRKFLKLCIYDLKKYGINTSNICYDNHNTSFFKIYSHNLFKFAKHIGFNHPRKQIDLIYHLRNGCSMKELDSINNKKLYLGYYDLREIDNLRVKGINNIFKKYRKKIGTQQKAANLLNTFRGNIKRWENGTNSTPFEFYLKLMELNGIELIDSIKILKKEDVVFGKGNIKQYIKLPLVFKEKYNELLQYLIPKGNKILIKSYGVDNRDLNRNILFKKAKNLFNVNVIKDSSSDIICSNILSSFLDIFYNYKISWNGLNNKEINKLKCYWKI